MSVAEITCPVSWLELERLELGELDAAREGAIRAHLDGCDACAACVRKIRDDAAVPLPALPAKARRAPASGGAEVVPLRRGPHPFFARAAGALALAASVALFVALRPDRSEGDGDSGGVKGADVALELVREGDDGSPREAGTFTDGDRFKALVTCPPRLAASWDLVVYDESGASFPLAPARLPCGNQTPMPGAFRLTGGDAVVCVAWSESGPVSRTLVGHLGPDDRTPGRVCRRLRRSR